jgi:uncharacterized membrane protein (UPF0127 family)
MDSNFGRAGFRIGIFIALMSGGLLFVLQKGTSEYLLMQVMFVLSLVFLAVIVLAIRLSLRK